MDGSNDRAKRLFEQAFGRGGRIHVVRAPGRVNLIGEHTDYNDGFVFPMAIEPEVRIVCRGREDGRVRLASTAYPGEVVEFSLQERITKGEPPWANYSKGVAAEMLAGGIPLTGMDALVSNTLPVGGGLSSSAALEVGTAWCFLVLGGLEMNISRMALLCQKAEHEFADTPCGIMDQTIVIGAKAGHAMLLDCRDLSKQFVLIDERELRVVIVNTMVRHELGAGEYAERRHQCEEGVAYFKSASSNVRALRDVSMKQLDSARRLLPEIVYRRCRHVITENARTTEAAAALGRRDYERAGELMNDSHRSLREDYEVTIPELDFLADEAQRVKGVYGSRMTGGGFGGCTVSLVQPRAVDAFVEQIRRAYEGKFRKTPDVYVTTATGGVSVLE